MISRLKAALKHLPIPRQLVISAIAVVALLVAGGVAFALSHAGTTHAPAAVARATGPASAPAAPAASCRGVVRDIYRQAVEDDPRVTLAEVRAEVLGSGVSCAPDPEVAAELKGLSLACRDMVQYTFLSVRDGNPEIKVREVRMKVIAKSVACEHDRRPMSPS